MDTHVHTGLVSNHCILFFDLISNNLFLMVGRGERPGNRGIRPGNPTGERPIPAGAVGLIRIWSGRENKLFLIRSLKINNKNIALFIFNI